MFPNLNSGYGQITGTFPLTASGKTFVVCPPASPYYGQRMLSLFRPDEDGVLRLFTSGNAALAACSDGRDDQVLFMPGSYDESIFIPFGLSEVTLRGLGGKGAVSIAPSTAGSSALAFNGNGLTCIDIDFAGNTTATSAVVGTGSRARFFNCKFEGADTAGSSFSWGPGSVAAIAAKTAGRGGDLQLYDCEFAWTFNGVTFTASDFGQATEIYMKDCWFHDCSNICLTDDPGAFGIGAVGDLTVVDSVFSNSENGTAPVQFVNVSDALDVGSFSGNRFAIATNAAAKLAIGANVLWMANATEAGWSTARPA